jgi:hypothetical protein
MNFSQLKSEVRTRLNESTTAFYTDTDIQDSLNEGLAEMADATEYYERHANIVLQADRVYYDLSTLLPDTFLSPRRIWNATANWWLKPTAVRDLDNKLALWESTNGQPNEYVMRGNWWLGVFPKSATDQQGLRVVYTAIPSSMSDDSDEPGFPREFHYGLVEYALFDCFIQQRETQKAMAYWQSYKTYEAALAQWVDKRQSLDRVSVLQ